MKKSRTAFSPAMKFCYLPLLLGVVIIGPGCRKSSQPDPCEGVLSEGMPAEVGLVFADRQTGENILLSKNIDAATITITPETEGVSPQAGVIVKQAGSPIHGTLVFHIADTKTGAFKYKINIPGVGSATLSYVNKLEKSDNKCKPHYIAVTDPVIEDHQFTVSRINSRPVLKVTI